jgi:hypothetical protein
VKMSVEDRDQWECLLADWSADYEFTRSDDESDTEPFKAAPSADPGALLAAASPRLLRTMIREDHTRRTTPAAPRRNDRAGQGLYAGPLS